MSTEQEFSDGAVFLWGIFFHHYFM